MPTDVEAMRELIAKAQVERVHGAATFAILNAAPGMLAEIEELRAEEMTTKAKLSAIDGAFNATGVPWAGRPRDETVRAVVAERDASRATPGTP